MRRKHKVGFSRIFAAIIGLILAVQLSGNTVFAEFNLDKECSITVTTGEDEFSEDLKSAKLVLDIYKLADAVQKDEAYETYSYETKAASPEFQSIIDKVNKKQAAGGNEEDWKDAWDTFAQEAAEAVRANKTKALDTVSIGSKKEGLSTGLYLVIARGSDLDPYGCIKDITNEDGKNVLVGTGTTAAWNYYFRPLLISVPVREENGEYTYTTGEPGEWTYDYNAVLKKERDPVPTETPPVTPTPSGNPTPTVTPPVTITPRPTTTPRPNSSVPTTPNTTRPVKTGDDTQRLPYIIGMSVSGLILLIFVFIFLKKRKNRE